VNDTNTSKENILLPLLDHLPFGIYQYKQWKNGRCLFVYVNRGIEKIVSIPVNELMEDGTPVWEKIHPEDRSRILNTALESGEEFDITVRIQTEPEIFRWIRIQGMPYLRDEDSITWCGGMEDVTDQKKNEEAAAQARREIEQKAAFILAFFDQCEDQFYYKDRQSRVLGGNRAWVKSRGARTIDELIGKTDIELHSAPLGQQLYDNEQLQMAAGKAVRLRERYAVEGERVQYLESIKCPVKNEQGEVIGLVGISRDITNQAEIEKQLIIAHEEAEAANKAKSSFLAMMSHEIRTPMNGVIGAASLLLSTELTPQQQELAHTIQVSGEDLLSIVNEILDYSKIEAGKIELEKEPFNLLECIEGAFDLFVPVAAKKNIELLYYIEPDIPEMLIGDATRLRQIIVNLLSNAVKFTEKGEISLKVQLAASSEEKKECRLQFSVSDTGIGIADEQKDRLFHSFTQADSSCTRKYGGTGLGLVISKRLTEIMGGKIGFESEENKGSTFFFTVHFPIADPPEKKAEPLPIEALRGKRVLIVDDNETNRELLSTQLAQWGVLSKAFQYPKEALAHLRNGFCYDLALIDHQMPEMDGSQLAKEIRGLQNVRPTPVIILSSLGEHTPADPSISAILSKPVKMSKLCRQMLETLSAMSEESARRTPPESQIKPRKKRDLRILIAEDNAINQRIVQIMLQRLGYENIVSVQNGEEAVAAVMDAEYDVVLMDVQMPRMNGLEATRLIRKQIRHAAKPRIIALTAGVMDEEKAAALQAGMDAFLAKPLKIEQLEEILKPSPHS
jgi:PAS domain S-box-containing protein